MRSFRKIILTLGILAIVIGGIWIWISRGNPSKLPLGATEGAQVEIRAPEEETIPTVGIATPVGWGPNEAPTAAHGLAVNRFAAGLNHPRTLLVLPNGDVLVAETDHPQVPGEGGGLFGAIQRFFWNKAGAGNPSPNRIILLRDADGDGSAEARFVLREKDLDSPSGMALVGGKLYVANHNAVLAFDFVPGATAITGNPAKVMDLPAGGNHWMRNLLASADGSKLYVAVGSASNIGENGMEAEKGRAAIFEYDIATGRKRQYGGGLRNPNGMDWSPVTGELWTVVNERDMLGPDLVPDYLTNVPVGAEYGWPWYYWKKYIDERVEEPMPEFLGEYVRKPEFAMGAHTAPLGLRFANEGNRLGSFYNSGAFIARHGSWNRKPLVGYDVVFVVFDEWGNPKSRPAPVLTGFLKEGNKARGRPVWLGFDKTGALLVTDDLGGMVWRVVSPGAAPLPKPKAVETPKMAPVRSIDSATEAQIRRQIEEALSKQ
ncbi:sorbosone dehydrogenase family protein [Novosphingobium sp. TH158]|uniref:PQQ-dependent sugar dehydrogenase n=1 Tax=Novosphingobium sp. TH158 TaxID=2067455 RepID=UPI000C7E3AFE|nr:PQQ-dependent sugar dehydrogenase [Novosphingobium sp. TH158]PLK27203.1 sorbosone dehydrogenase [Novosphingobium sp. TH158]